MAKTVITTSPMTSGLTTAGGNVQVTSYGADGTYCRSTGWSSGASGTTAYVRCVNSSGAAVDHNFTLQYVK